MMEGPILTAIIFTYNHEDFIAKCIESILYQKTDYKYEIHIWDDCSKDDTSKICRKYAAAYPDKIKCTIQKKNTFCYPGILHQTYPAISQVTTKYMCIIDGDDWWCDENKIQIAIDFLEKNPSYIGFAHDTLQEEVFLNMKRSYIHEVLNLTVDNPVTFSSKAPFFLTSSRIFRTSDYKEKKILPIDYLFYYYHLAKGPIYYYDKIMAVYNIGQNSTFANMKTKNIINLTSLFAYKLAKLFDFTKNDFCLEYQLAMDTRNGIGEKRYKTIQRFQKIFGNKWGWHLWAFITFVPKFGIECLDINYVYSRKKAKKISDGIIIISKKRYYWLLFLKSKASLVKQAILYGLKINSQFIKSDAFNEKLHVWLKRKNRRILKYRKELRKMIKRMK